MFLLVKMNFSIASYDWNSYSHVLVTVNVLSDFKSLHKRLYVSYFYCRIVISYFIVSCSFCYCIVYFLQCVDCVLCCCTVCIYIFCSCCAGKQVSTDAAFPLNSLNHSLKLSLNFSTSI